VTDEPINNNNSGDTIQNQPEATEAVDAHETDAGTDANANQQVDDLNEYSERLERLGGEPAPVITPEEFARLQRAGQVHIDARGRVRTTRRSDAEAGVSLRKRRAWYG
jgi:hypothetical protein